MTALKMDVWPTEQLRRVFHANCLRLTAPVVAVWPMAQLRSAVIQAVDSCSRRWCTVYGTAAVRLHTNCQRLTESDMCV